MTRASSDIEQVVDVGHGHQTVQSKSLTFAAGGGRIFPGGFRSGPWVVTRFLTPGRGLALGLNGTEICSGLVAQAMCRGWDVFDVDPASISPAELYDHYSVSAR